MKKVIYATDRLEKQDIIKELGNSSGLILEEDDETITIGYIDYDVSEFGDRDYECYYKLDENNTKLFKSYLNDKYDGDLFDKCVQAFSIKFSNTLFEKFCKDYNISYSKHTY